MKKELSSGDRVPAFKIATDDRGEISPASFKGKPFVIYFYPKDNTSGCTREAIDFSDSKKRFDALGVEVVGISKDSIASHEKFRKKHKLKISLASDPEKEAAEAFGVWVQKSLYGRIYMGMDRATFLVDSQGIIRQVWRKVKVAGHVNAVLSAAKAL